LNNIDDSGGAYRKPLNKSLPGTDLLGSVLYCDEVRFSRILNSIICNLATLGVNVISENIHDPHDQC